MGFTKEEIAKSINVETPYYSEKVFAYFGALLSRVFLKTRVTPNQLTWVWGALLVFSSLLLVFNNWCLNIIVGLCWILGYSMDYTDGSIARLKKIYSKRGMFLDYVNHTVSYFALMICAGIGVYRTGGCPYFDILPDWIYLALGAVAALGMDLILLMPTMYRRACGNTTGDSADIEGGAVQNKGRFILMMNLNPLTFTNMMLLIVFFALFDLMWLFVLLYGAGYLFGSMVRLAVLYKSVPARDPPKD